MNSLCDSYLTDDSLHELSEMSDFFLSSVAEHIKAEPADVIEEVGHVVLTQRAPAVILLCAKRVCGCGCVYVIDPYKVKSRVVEEHCSALFLNDHIYDDAERRSI